MTTTVTKEQIDTARAHPAWEAYRAKARTLVMDATGQDSAAWIDAVAACLSINGEIKVIRRRRDRKAPTLGAVLIGSSSAGFCVWAY